MTFSAVCRETRCICVHQWGDHSQQLSGHRAICSSLLHLPSRTVERTGMAKERKPVGQDKDSSIKWRKTEKTQMMQRQSLTTSHKTSNVLPVSEQQPLWKPNTLTPPSPSSSTRVEYDVIFERGVTWYGISLWPNQVSCPSCVPFQLLAHLSLLACENFHILESWSFGAVITFIFLPFWG